MSGVTHVLDMNAACADCEYLERMGRVVHSHKKRSGRPSGKRLRDRLVNQEIIKWPRDGEGPYEDAEEEVRVVVRCGVGVVLD